MKDYQEFQFGWIIFVFVIAEQMLITYFYLHVIGDRPLQTNGFLVINLLSMLTYLLFYGLTTKITADSLKVSFGIGLVSKRIQLNRISTVETVKNPWYDGWGIRFIPKSMLYNISGWQAIELKFSDTDKVLRIGTSNAMKLKNEIEKRLT